MNNKYLPYILGAGVIVLLLVISRNSGGGRQNATVTSIHTIPNTDNTALDSTLSNERVAKFGLTTDVIKSYFGYDVAKDQTRDAYNLGTLQTNNDYRLGSQQSTDQYNLGALTAGYDYSLGTKAIDADVAKANLQYNLGTQTLAEQGREATLTASIGSQSILANLQAIIAQIRGETKQTRIKQTGQTTRAQIDAQRQAQLAQIQANAAAHRENLGFFGSLISSIFSFLPFVLP